MKNNKEFLPQANAIVSKVIDAFSDIRSPDREYHLDKIPPIAVTDDNPNSKWQHRSSRPRPKPTHSPSQGVDIRISRQLISERARLIDPRPSNILNDFMYAIEGLNRTTANQRVGVATAVLTLEAITSSHNYNSPTEAEYANLQRVLQELGYQTNFAKR